MKILIATDGSEFSQKAVEESCRLFPDSAMKVMTVFKSFDPITPMPFNVPEIHLQNIDKEAKEEAEKIAKDVEKIIHRKCPKIKLTTEVEELTSGTVSQTIIENAREWKPDLIVVGTHGKGFWGRLISGSVSDDLVHQAPCPVLVVRH